MVNEDLPRQPLTIMRMLLRCSYLYDLLGSHFLVRSIAHDATGAEITLGIVRFIQGCDRNAFGCRMGKFVVANVNSDMRDAAAARIEEYEIACAKFIVGNFGCLFPTEHIPRRTGQIDAEFVEDVPRKAGAVESARCRSAVLVVSSDERCNRFV